MTAPNSPACDRAIIDFWSSTELPPFLSGLTHALSAYGFAGRQRFEISESRYRGARGRMARLALRWRAYVRYPWALWRSFRSSARPNVAVVCTNTFYAPRIAERAARELAVVHWVFDLFPDVLVASGSLRNSSMVSRWLDRLTRSTFDHASINVFLGERLRAHAVARFGPIPRSVVIPVGCDARPFVGMPPVKRNEGAPVRMLYCGNLGRMHDVDTIIRMLHAGLPEAIELGFRGNGAGFRQLEMAVHSQDLGGRVSIGGSLQETEWIAAMGAADVALVTMKPGAEGVMMPSKTYSALAAGQAVVAICPEASDLADTIKAHDCGWVVVPGDVKRLSELLIEIVRQPAELLRRRQNAWRAGQQVFDQRALATAWHEALEAALNYKPNQDDEAHI